MYAKISKNTLAMRSRFANVASELAKNGGYLYSSFGEANVQLYLGFNGNSRGTQVTFINPYWAGQPYLVELLPASQTDIVVTLSPEAEKLGARSVIEFNGSSPRIKVSFLSSPTSPFRVGSVTLGFRGVWPLKGAYYCSELQSQTALLPKALEPFGTIVLRNTVTRLLVDVVNEAVRRGAWRIDAIDTLSLDFIRDNLVADLCDLLLDDVGKRSLMLKTNNGLPNGITNSYENSQDGIFTRTVALTI